MCSQATKKPPLPLEGMNPQALPPYNNLADWDYGIDNTERWYAKTALDWHYAAGGLHPMDYNNRLSAIMVATMWSHLVAVFADLPAPGPAYDGGQLFKACQKHRKRAMHCSWWGLLCCQWCVFRSYRLQLPQATSHQS